MVYQIDGHCKRLLWVGRERKAATLEGFFHIMSHFSQAIDEVRPAEARKLAAEGRAPVLKHSRWLLLKRPENLTDGQAERLAELVRRNLRTVRAYLLKEDFQRCGATCRRTGRGGFSTAGALGRCARGSNR